MPGPGRPAARFQVVEGMACSRQRRGTSHSVGAMAGQRGPPAVAMEGLLHDRARPNHPVLGDDDDPVPNVVAVAVGLLHARLVDEPGAVANSGVLVDDDAVELDVAADAE